LLLLPVAAANIALENITQGNFTPQEQRLEVNYDWNVPYTLKPFSTAKSAQLTAAAAASCRR
jgi:hypothetical protein